MTLPTDTARPLSTPAAKAPSTASTARKSAEPAATPRDLMVGVEFGVWCCCTGA